MSSNARDSRRNLSLQRQQEESLALETAGGISRSETSKRILSCSSFLLIRYQRHAHSQQGTKKRKIIFIVYQDKES